MVYTCYEMIRDCRAGKAEGWRYFVSNYVPLIRKLLAHYAPDSPALLEQVLSDARRPESSLLQSLEPAPERQFLGELRQKVLAALPVASAEIVVDLDTVAEAFEPLTLLEKQVAWIETMHFDAQATGAMLRMAPRTVESIRERASELLRGKVDSWRREIGRAHV